MVWENTRPLISGFFLIQILQNQFSFYTKIIKKLLINRRRTALDDVITLGFVPIKKYTEAWIDANKRKPETNEESLMKLFLRELNKDKVLIYSLSSVIF